TTSTSGVTLMSAWMRPLWRVFPERSFIRIECSLKCEAGTAARLLRGLLPALRGLLRRHPAAAAATHLRRHHRGTPFAHHAVQHLAGGLVDIDGEVVHLAG